MNAGHQPGGRRRLAGGTEHVHRPALLQELDRVENLAGSGETAARTFGSARQDKVFITTDQTESRTRGSPPRIEASVSAQSSLPYVQDADAACADLTERLQRYRSLVGRPAKRRHAGGTAPPGWPAEPRTTRSQSLGRRRYQSSSPGHGRLLSWQPRVGDQRADEVIPGRAAAGRTPRPDPAPPGRPWSRPGCLVG